MKKKLIIYPLVVLGIFLPLTAESCGQNDAGKGERDNGSAKAIINMPDHFNNVALKCRGTTGVYVTNNSGDGGTGSSLALLADDPECKDETTP